MAAALGQDLPDVEALLAHLLEHGLQLQHAGLPAAVVFDQRADVREADAEAVQQPEQGPFHHRALVEKAMIEAHPDRSEEHTSELQSLMRNTYAVFCLNKQNKKIQ